MSSSATTDIQIKPKFHPDPNPTTTKRNFSAKNLQVNFISHLILPLDKPPLANHPHLHVLSEPWNLETLQLMCKYERLMNSHLEGK